MKKYILNKYNKILVKDKKKDDRNLFYIIIDEDDRFHPVFLKMDEEYYRFAEGVGDNVFSEKDSLLRKAMIKQTNNFLVFLFWKIKYRKYNRRWR